jgi:hypothetical protein
MAVNERQTTVLKTYPHEGVCLGAKTCGRCRDLREEEAANDALVKQIETLAGKKIVSASYVKEGGDFELKLEDGRRVIFTSHRAIAAMNIYEPETKKG